MTPSKGGRKPLTRYTLTNPHDAYEFDAADDSVADAVCLLLGGGWYSWSTADGTGALVALLDENDQTAAALAVKDTCHEHRREVVEALRSVEIDPDGRREAGADPDAWHEEHRSSFTDPRENAIATAAAMEQGA